MEKLEMELVLLTENFDKGVKKAEATVKNVKNSTKKDREMELALNLAKVRTQYDELKGMIREAKRMGNEAVVIHLQMKAEQMKLDLNDANRALRNFRNTGDETKSMLGQMLDNAGIMGFFKNFIGPAGIGGAISGLFHLGQQAERTEIAFGQIVGSMKEGSKLYRDLQEFAKETPFGDGVVQAAKMMMAMGFEAEKILPTMKSVGEAVSAMGGSDAELMSVARALGQIQAKGKLSAEEVNQLAERGIGVWQILSKEMNTSVAELQDMGEKGKLLAKDVLPIILSSFEKNYGGMMEKMSETAQGQLDELIATFQKVVADLGKVLAPIFTVILKGIIGIVNFFQSGIGKLTLFTTAVTAGGVAVVALITKLGVLAGVFGASTFAIGSATTAVGLFGTALKLAMGPVGWIIGGLSLLGGAIFGVMKANEEATKRQQELVYQAMSSAEKIEYQKKKVQELTEAKRQGNITEEEYKQKLAETNAEIESQTQMLEKLKEKKEELEKFENKRKQFKTDNDVDGMRENLHNIQAYREEKRKALEEEMKSVETAYRQNEEFLRQEKAIWQEAMWLYMKGVRDFNEQNARLQALRQKYQDEEIQRRGLNVEAINKEIRELEALQVQQERDIILFGEKSDAQVHLENTTKNLRAEQEKLREEYRQSQINTEEYNKKMAENTKALEEAEFATAEYRKGLSIVGDEQLSYMEKIRQMNGLKLNANAYNALIEKLKGVAQVALTALRIKQKLLDQAISGDLVQGADRVTKLTQYAPGGLGVASKIFQSGKNFVNNTEWGKGLKEGFLERAKIAKAETEKNIQTLENDLENALKNVKNVGSGGGGGGKKGRGGGGGKSKASKEAEKKKKEEEKQEKELANVRTQAYEQGGRQAEKYNEVITATNKKLEEQRKKLEEIKKQAEETIKDLEQKLVDSQNSFHEKLAKRYSEIIKEIKEAVGDLGEGKTEADYEEHFFGIVDTKYNTLKEELKLLKSQVDDETLKLELKKEARSETEKITEEYKKQKEMTEQSLKVQKAIRDGKYVTHAETGKIEFFDEEGKMIEAKSREQEKEFAELAKKLQVIADEELKIGMEQTAELAKIEKEFQNERERLNKNYFREDKALRLEQNRLSEEFFQQEIKRLAHIRTDAISAASALREVQGLGGNPSSIVQNYDNRVIHHNASSNNINQNITVKTPSDIKYINKGLGTNIGLHSFKG